MESTQIHTISLGIVGSIAIAIAYTQERSLENWRRTSQGIGPSGVRLVQFRRAGFRCPAKDEWRVAGVGRLYILEQKG